MTAREAVNSPVFNSDGTIGRIMIVEGTIDLEQALGEAFRAAPVTSNGLIRKGAPDGRPNGRGIWEFEFKYGAVESEEPTGDGPTLGTLEVNSSGGSTHVTQCRSIVGYGGDNRPALKSRLEAARVVGWHKGGVNGVDIATPGASIVLTRKFLPEVISGNYIKALMDLYGYINYYPYTIAWATGKLAYSMRFEPTELRFGNARAAIGRTAKGLTCWDISYEFIHSRNITDLYMGNSITIPLKGGHHYVWSVYKDEEVAGAKLEVPEMVFQSRMYDFADFAYVLGF
jgi:hypothetical protein